MHQSLQKIQKRLASEAAAHSFSKEVQQWPWDRWFALDKRHKTDSRWKKEGAFQVVEGDMICEYALEDAPKYIQQLVLRHFDKERNQEKVDLLFQAKAHLHRVIVIQKKSSVSLVFHNSVFTRDSVYYVIVEPGARVDIHENYQKSKGIVPDQLGGTSVFLIVQEGAFVNYVIASDVRYSYQAFYSVSLGEQSQCCLYPFQKMHKFQHVTFSVNQPANQSQMRLRGVLESEGTSRSVLRLVANQTGEQTEVDMRYRVIARDTAFLRVDGNIQVGLHASLNKSFLEAKALLLSPTALVRVLPHLEILNNDVTCAHSASVGYLPIEPLYYMMSRGIGEENARQLLIQAFLKEIFVSVQDRQIQCKI